MSNEDSDLIRRAKLGEPDAFAKIYEQYYAKIYSYIYYRIHDQPLAEDLAADVFVRLVKSIGSFEERGRPLLAWLYTIAGNLLRDHIRRAKRIEFSPIDDREFASDEDPTRALDLSFDSQRLVNALQHLTEEQANVILLKFVQGLSNAEVGRIIGKKEGSVKSLQHRALRSLKRLLSAEKVE
ncbi:MAG: sigma-70 family RNA polymerase sigma factor [Candidatus Promineifilaceae bacterium]